MFRKTVEIITESVKDKALQDALCEGAKVCFEAGYRKMLECANSNLLMEDAEDAVDTPDSDIFGKIEKGEWDTNGDLAHDYPIFMDSLRKSRHPEALTWYTEEDYAAKGAKLFKVAGYDAGFAVDKEGDIISVHNNTTVRGVAPYLIRKAKELGGTHLDHYDIGRLNDVYGSEGLAEYKRFDWNDQYAPEGWDYEKFGRPAVILRKLDSWDPPPESDGE